MCVNSLCMPVYAHPRISEIFVSCASHLIKVMPCENKGTDDWYIMYMTSCHPEKNLSCLSTQCVCVCYTEWIHMLRHARISSPLKCWQMCYSLSLLHFSLPFFPPDKSHPFNQMHPFHFLLSLSRHFSFLFSTPRSVFTPPSCSFSFTSSISVNTWWVSSRSPPSLLPSLFSFCLCHHLHVRNQIKLLPSTDTHMHAVSRPCWGMCISSPPPSSFPPQFRTFSPPPSCSAHYLHLSSACLSLYLFLSSWPGTLSWILLQCFRFKTWIFVSKSQ